MISGGTSVGYPTEQTEAADETSDSIYITRKNVDSLKKLQILLAVNVLTRAGVPATTDSIEYVTHIPRRRIVDLIRRYSCRYKLLTKMPRTDEDTKLRGYFVYTLTKKGKFALNDMVARFNENRNLRKRRNDRIEDHRDIVLLPGMTDAIMAALTGESPEEDEDERDERRTRDEKYGRHIKQKTHDSGRIQKTKFCLYQTHSCQLVVSP